MAAEQEVVGELQSNENNFPEDNFELESCKKSTIAQKRERFWKRNSDRFTVISTIAMFIMFGLAYLVYVVLADLFTNYTFMR